jgi:hypothetical protein
MPGTSSQGQSCPSGKSRPPSLAHFFICGAKSSSSRSDPMGRCSRSSTSPHLDGSLAQAICRGTSSCANAQACFSASSSTTYRALALPLEVVRSARTKCVVGTATAAHHSRRCPRLSCYQVTQEERANKETISASGYFPSELLMRARSFCLFSINSSISLLLACLQLVAHPVGIA